MIIQYHPITQPSKQSCHRTHGIPAAQPGIGARRDCTYNENMCKDLNEELKRGDEAMVAIANHLTSMGAANLEKIVAGNNGVLVKITAVIVSRV